MEIPVIQIEGDGIAEVWEKSVLALWEKGVDIETEYDKQGAALSKDVTMIMVVRDPFSQPRIHMGFAGGIEDLEKYRQEVVLGIHDHWINPDEGKWTYTYHDRLVNYRIPGNDCEAVDQIDYIIEKLSKVSYSRRAQAVTWIPFYDPKTYDPPCLQRIWCRIFQQGEELFLAMNTHWRSRDAYRAAFMNIYGLTELQKYIAEKISDKIEKPVKVGRYVDITDSYHIYGDSLSDFRERFLKLLDKRDFFNSDRIKSRTMSSDDPAAVAGIEYGKQLIEKEKQTGKKGAIL